MHQKSLIYLLPLLTIGLSGWVLFRRKKSLSNSFDYLNKSRYSGLKKYIIAQSKLESANYKSALFLRSNNPFGMKNASKRVQLGYPVPGDPYRHYNNLLEAIQDFELYLDYVRFPEVVNSPEMYAGNLKRLNYFESDLKDYVTGLKSWL
jgi:uncharacterized FlgJ-related protein